MAQNDLIDLPAVRAISRHMFETPMCFLFLGRPALSVG